MTPKEENEKLIAENTRLKQENAGVISSINTSRLVLETAKKQEAEGRAILLELADDVEAINSTLTLVSKEAESTLSETVKLNVEKASLESQINTLKEEAKLVSALNKSNNDIEVDALKSTIQVKQNELTEVLSKIKTESFNLVSIKSEIATLKEDLSKSQSYYDELSSKCDAKDGELDNLNEDYIAVSSALILAKQALKDTEISAEAHIDKKAQLIIEIGDMQNEITANKNTIANLVNEITDIEAKKAEKEAEYKASESKIFELVRREEALGEREAYAKERFKVAGLEY